MLSAADPHIIIKIDHVVESSFLEYFIYQTLSMPASDYGSPDGGSFGGISSV